MNTPSESNRKYVKKSISMLPELYEMAKRKAESMRPRVSVSAYICSVLEKDLEEVEERKGPPPKINFKNEKPEAASSQPRRSGSHSGNQNHAK